jgi:hypothetical protein
MARGIRKRLLCATGARGVTALAGLAVCGAVACRAGIIAARAPRAAQSGREFGCAGQIAYLPHELRWGKSRRRIPCISRMPSVTVAQSETSRKTNGGAVRSNFSIRDRDAGENDACSA